ncbi:SGNH/GDSL hydrolase family protein [Aspergillus homomorphus CBS 101889]|uniref:Esterase family protein n=1 Tax=Aspergillus homomorphus (strain CBS 101889) TaxID=1450537 RepID=A0A395I3U8_ASPHC|nr:esterase family protein [Aspergillus homomorphus CBS 101889]RAL14760.1 esterase family protein [Aspergillus homomorphus CBS 101889]
MIILILLLCLLASHAISTNSSSFDSFANATTFQHIANSAPPTDFSWINKWAAVGDSYTAGIGSGALWTEREEDRKCSRYDKSYPGLLHDVLGHQVKLFQYKACSGDRTGQIFDQIKNLDSNLDLVVITAGGNDLCLADIIKACIFLPFQGEDKCQEVLDLAQHNIERVLMPNIRKIIYAMQPKLSYNGFIVWVLYGQFFNIENEDCATKQDWSFPRLDPVAGGLSLTIDNRKKFNQLVVNINQAIRDVIYSISPRPWSSPYIRTADWDAFMRDGLHGQYCVPGSTGQYPDPSQPYLHFFKPDTTVSGHRDLRKKDVDDLMHLANHDPLLGAKITSERHYLRDVLLATPNCPADSGSIGLGLPDRWGKYFHPNELGHKTIASFVLSEIVAQRAVILQAENPRCQANADLFQCWQQQGRQDYASADLMNENYKIYCREYRPPTGHYEKEYVDERWFNYQTPDTHWFRLTLRNGAVFDKQQCLDSFDRVINSCDGNDPENPLNWKFGGRWVRGNYIYEVGVSNSFKRPWPVIKAVDGSCRGKYKFIFSDYTLRGKGWSTADFGQKCIRPRMVGCLGKGISVFDWKYLNGAEEHDGMEWELSVRVPIATSSRCFKNNRIAFECGGFTHGCEGNG